MPSIKRRHLTSRENSIIPYIYSTETVKTDNPLRKKVSSNSLKLMEETNQTFLILDLKSEIDLRLSFSQEKKQPFCLHSSVDQTKQLFVIISPLCLGYNFLAFSLALRIVVFCDKSENIYASLIEANISFFFSKQK